MAERQAPSLFESFNARNLAPEQVALTFVAPEQFRRLIGQHHTLIIGPRGSGKTTLLKMMQQPALDAWTGAVADELRSQISYTGVYVATDISWGEQIECLGLNVLSEEHQAVLGVASFTTQILRSLVSAMDYLIRANNSGHHLSSESEQEVAQEIGRAWRLDGSHVSLRSVKYALNRRLSEIHDFAVRESILGETGRDQRLASRSGLTLSFLSASSSAVDVFNDAIGVSDKRWAFLFDELELAPESIRRALLRSLRSVDDRLLFKLSLVPYGNDVDDFGTALSAMEGHDFELIPLWYAHKEDGYPFCNLLWQSMVASRSLGERSPTSVLGESVFETSAEEWKEAGTAYRPDSRLAKRFESLAGKDPTFRTFLAEQGISVTQLTELEGDERAATVRKATSIVAVRDGLIRRVTVDVGGVRVNLRSRKVTGLYSGASAVFAVTEGNPRWFKGIVRPMLDLISVRKKKVTATEQSRIVQKAITRFRALLRTIPCPPFRGNQPPRGLLTLLDDAGNSFHRSLVLGEFTLDPVGSFIVDSRANDAIIETLGHALNAGAIVLMEDESSETPQPSLRGKRFRLSYLLAPHYKLLLRAARGVSLQRVLERSHGPSLLDQLDDSSASG